MVGNSDGKVTRAGLNITSKTLEFTARASNQQIRIRDLKIEYERLTQECGMYEFFKV